MRDTRRSARLPAPGSPVPPQRAGLLVLAAFLVVSLAVGLAASFAFPRAALGEDKLVEGAQHAVSPAADARIRKSLSAAFARIDPFREIKVAVNDGVVELTGSAPSFATAQKAVQFASRIEGVFYVVDDVTVRAEVDTRLRPVWANLRDLAAKAVDFAPLAAVALAIFVALALLGWLVSSLDWPFRRFSDRVLLQNLLRQLALYGFAFIGLLAALDMLELTPLLGAVMGAAGLFGLGLGFAFKEIVENYVSGFLLSLRSPFSYMDWIEVAGHEGSVVRVTSRELVLMTLQGNHIRIPNAQVFKGVISNYTRNPLRRFDIPVGIGVGEDLSEVQRVGCDVLRAMNGVMAEPAPAMQNLEFGDSSMLVRFSGWVDQSAVDYLKVRSEAVRILKEALDQAGVDLPVPIQTVINVDPVQQRQLQEEKRQQTAQILSDAEHADVGRESFLDDQIEHDRRSSGEEDLLEKRKK